DLAANPLLCAMICALHRIRQTTLPRNRTELYDKCLEMLVDRREKERIDPINEVDLKLPELNIMQKVEVLKTIAYEMMLNGFTEADISFVETQVNREIESLKGLPLDATSKNVLKLLVERSSVLREPVPSKIEFAHRSFQEFLAAKEAWDRNAINWMVDHAHEMRFRGMIVLATSMGNKHNSEDLISKIIFKAEKENQQSDKIPLLILALACLDTQVDKVDR